MNVGLVCHSTLGGSGTVAAELALALAGLGHTVHLLARSLPPRLVGRTAGVRYHPVPEVADPVLGASHEALTLAGRIAEVAEAERLDLVHAHYAMPFAVSACLARALLRGRRRLPVVTTLHGTDVTVLGHDPEFGPITRFGVAASDGVTAVSAHLAVAARQAFGGPEPRVIPNFVDVDRFRPASPELRRPPGGERRLLHVSNFRAVKRAGDCLDILALVAREVPCRLVLVGAGPELGPVRERAEQLGLAGRVTFAGALTSVVEPLRQADVLLLPSASEAFGLAALEAMSCAVPVVASRVGGLPEVVADGRCGLLCPVGDVASMADAVLGLLRDPDRAESFGQAGRQIAVAQFPAARIAAAYVEFYREVIARVAAGPEPSEP